MASKPAGLHIQKDVPLNQVPVGGENFKTLSPLDYNNLREPVGRLESAWASLELSSFSSPVSSIINEITDADYGPKIPAKELNEQHSDLGGYFKEPMTKGLADQVARQQRYKMELQDKISRGPDDTLQSILGFVSSMVPHAVDPINIAGGRVAGLALKGAKRGGWATKAFVEGALGNIPGEIYSYSVQKKMQENVTPMDPATNILGGAALGVGLQGLGRAISHLRGANAVDAPKKAPEIVPEKAPAQIAENQILGEKLVDVEPMHKIREAVQAEGMTPRTAQEVADYHAKMNEEAAHEWFDREADLEADEMIKEIDGVFREGIEKEADNFLEDLSELEKSGALDEATVKEIDEIRQMKADEPLMNRILNAAIHCVRVNG